MEKKKKRKEKKQDKFRGKVLQKFFGKEVAIIE